MEKIRQIFFALCEKKKELWESKDEKLEKLLNFQKTDVICQICQLQIIFKILKK